MKGNKILSLLLVALMAVTCLTGCSKKGDLVDGTWTGTANGFGGQVSVTLTVKNGSVDSVVCEGPDETPAIGGAALETLADQIKKAGSAEIDGVSGASFTTAGIKEAAESAFAQAKSGEAATAWVNVPVTYTAGTYEGTAAGYNGDVTLSVTFSEDAITDIQVTASKETDHVGTVAYDILKADAIEANGAGVDSVSGATFTSKAYKAALVEAATAAGASDIDGFSKNTVVHEAQADEDLGTYDVVVVGAGGAGMATAAQAAQNGLTVLVLEENAAIGGDTLVSGGQFQAVMDYLVWDPANPDATEATWDYNGKTYTKVKAAKGQLETLKEIYNWSEEPFEYAADEEFEAGDIEQLAPHGVHAEYLSTLQALKKEIKAYVDWADAKIAAGAEETDLTLFSTVNLHIFQTYYGGLRRSADGTTWVYGDYDLVKQFCEEGYDVKTWLEDQGSTFNDATTITLIGALWYRENINTGCDLDGDGTNESYGSNNWNTYFAPMENTLLKTSTTAADNKIETRVTVDKLVTDANGKVVGVEGHRYDGTKVTASANGGVVLATGGYAANTEMVMEYNEYWDSAYLTDSIKTTNRSSLQGDGIEMAEEVNAGTTGMGFAQMMPISWIDNGNLAFGNGLYAVYINPTTGKRFVDESAERDVLSLGEFANGVEVNGTKGVFMEITNSQTALTYPYPYDTYEGTKVVKLGDTDVEERVYYFSSKEELQTILDEYGMTASPDDIYATIEQYDKDIHDGLTESEGVKKMQSTYSIGNWDDAGNYTLEGVKLRVRLMAPSTHHTMGGLTVDLDRHVLDTKGNVIEGLYAAGEVTGGIHGGNRLGGNAIVEILVSGRTAANTITEALGK